MNYLAYATTSDSMPGAGAGITVFDADDNAVVTETVASELDGGDEYGEYAHDLDEDAADALLARMGYTRDGQWVESGGQWGAEVVAA